MTVMSKGERIAARCGIAAALVLVVVTHLATAGWALGLIAGWLLCAGVNRGRRP